MIFKYLSILQRSDTRSELSPCFLILITDTRTQINQFNATAVQKINKKTVKFCGKIHSKILWVYVYIYLIMHHSKCISTVEMAIHCFKVYIYININK